MSAEGLQRFPTEQCRTETCRASIIWARTASGKSMPVDAEPVIDGSGNVQLAFKQGVVRARVYTKGELAAMSAEERAQLDLRVSHFVTCVRAADWRTR